MDFNKGSEIAKNGFQEEQNVVDIFNDWQQNKIAQDWLIAMNYNISEIEYVYATKISGSYKADIQTQLTIKLKCQIDAQNIQVKLVSNKRGFNQIDKRWLDTYNELWNIPANTLKLLKYFSGELPPYRNDTKDKRRMFANEFTKEEQNEILQFLHTNQLEIVSDILKGRGKYSAEWVLVIVKNHDFKWVLKNINAVMSFYGGGDIIITPRGSFKIGRITIQRKGGDAGRNTANMLQFKIDPTELFQI